MYIYIYISIINKKGWALTPNGGIVPGQSRAADKVHAAIRTTLGLPSMTRHHFACLIRTPPDNKIIIIIIVITIKFTNIVLLVL